MLVYPILIKMAEKEAENSLNEDARNTQPTSNNREFNNKIKFRNIFSLNCSFNVLQWTFDWFY